MIVSKLARWIWDLKQLAVIDDTSVIDFRFDKEYNFTLVIDLEASQDDDVVFEVYFQTIKESFFCEFPDLDGAYTVTKISPFVVKIMK